MTSWITSATLGAAFAASAAALWATASFAQQPLVVGAVVSESGSHAAIAADYRKGLVLWQEEVNRAGGLLGQPVEVRFADDGSEAVRARREYARLISAGAQVLIGPYGSAATLAGAVEAEAAKRVMLNAAGPSGEVHKRALRYVFQVCPPYTAYGEGVLNAAQQAEARSLFILARDDGASREMAEAAAAQAKQQGLAAQLEFFSPGTDDFLPQLYKAMGAQADAWVAYAQPRDAAEMVKTLKRHGYVPRIVYARSSTDGRFIQRIGQDAEFILGSVAYDARFTTQGNAAFVQAFKAKWPEPPGALAAAAYAAGSVLSEAVRRAGSADPEKLRAALAALELDTVLGRYKVDANGAQTGIKPVLTQIIRGRAVAVWPAALAGDHRLAAFTPWSEREILQ